MEKIPFVTKEQIEEIYRQQLASPETRIAQKTLAYEVVKDIHGAEEADKAVSGAKAAFSGEGNKSDMPTVELEKSAIENGIGAIDLFFNAKLSATKSDARRLIEQGGASINGKPVSNVKVVLSTADLDKDGELVLKAGKKKFCRIIFS